jgi:ribosomal protein L37AE/L43A
MSTNTMMTGPADQACPGCGDTTGAHPSPGISPRVKAWSCTACQTDWATTTVNPQPYFDRLAATVEQLGTTRSALRTVITLTDDAATLPDQELRDRLLALADRAKLTQYPTVEDPQGVTLPR